MRNGARNLSAANLERVRRLRRDMSVSERVLWALLRKKQSGFLFRRQHPVGPYVLDFYCPEAALCVEVDGEQHAERGAADARRDQWLLSEGILTIRIPSLDLFDAQGLKAGHWVTRVAELCAERAGH